MGHAGSANLVIKGDGATGKPPERWACNGDRGVSVGTDDDRGEREEPGSIVDLTGPVRVLLVDDHQTFAQSLALALNTEVDVTCVGQASDAAAAHEAAARLQPDVALVDVRLGEQDGLVLAEQLVDTYPGLRVIVLTASVDPADIGRAAAAGACGFLR